MRASGLLTKDTAMDLKGLAMETSTRENITKEKFRDRAYTLGAQARSMKDSGKMAIKKGMVSGMVFLETHTSDSGKKTSLMVLVSILGAMAMFTKVNGKLVSVMVKALTSLQLAIATQVNTNGVKLKAMVSIYGSTATHTLASFTMDRKTDKAIGKRPETSIQISTAESTKMTKSMVMVSSSGALAVNTKVTM